MIHVPQINVNSTLGLYLDLVHYSFKNKMANAGIGLISCLTWKPGFAGSLSCILSIQARTTLSTPINNTVCLVDMLLLDAFTVCHQRCCLSLGKTRWQRKQLLSFKEECEREPGRPEESRKRPCCWGRNGQRPNT